jgi:GNAT superfamily N-acetyltransferase
MSLSLKVLMYSDFHLIEDKCKEIGARLGNCTVAVATAFDDDRVVGILSMQYMNHAGQLWVDPEYRRRGLAKQLGLMIETLPFPEGSSYLMFPSNPASQAVARSLGLTRLDLEVWQRKF